MSRFELNKLYGKTGAKRVTASCDITGEEMKIHFPDLVLKKQSSSKRKTESKGDGPSSKKTKAVTSKKRKSASGSPPTVPTACNREQWEAKQQTLLGRSVSGSLGLIVLPEDGPKDPQPGGVDCIARLDGIGDGDGDLVFK